MNKQPNILVIMADQHRADCIGAAGHPTLHTPHLDRLCNEGWRSERAYCQNPICTPSRMSVLTGCYPSTHGYYGLYGLYGRAPDTAFTSLFGWCGQQGYRTGVLGKIHTPRYWLERQVDFVYDEFLEYPNYLEALGLHQENDSRGYESPCRSPGPSTIPLEHSCEMALVQRSLRFIDNQMEPKDRPDADEPWAAWVSFSRPHGPLTPSEPFASRHPADKLDLPDPGPMPNERLRRMQARHQVDPDLLRRKVSAYLGLVEQVDHGIGELLAGLETRGELDNTIVVYLSDHGEYAGLHGMFEKQPGLAWDCITRIPFIIRAPGQAPAGATSQALVESIDLFPTLCGLAGLPAPRTLQGCDLGPLVRGETQSVREDCLTENADGKALTTERYRYVVGIGGSDLLFDLHDDPQEQHNRADDPDHAAIRTELCHRLLQRVAAARKPITTGRGHWHQHHYDEDGFAHYADGTATPPAWRTN